MDAIRVNENTRVNQVSSRTQLVRSDSNLIGFFIGDKTMEVRPNRYQLYQKKYQQSKKGKATYSRFRQTEKHKIWWKKYNHSDKCKIKQKKYRIQYPERIIANNVVGHAIRDGKLLSAKTFQCLCGKQAEQYHHHKGYAKKHWLDVIPVCRKCHREIHIKAKRDIA